MLWLGRVPIWSRFTIPEHDQCRPIEGSTKMNVSQIASHVCYLVAQTNPASETSRPNMPKARINGFEMYYEERGAGAPVVYVHGGYAGAVTRVDPGEWDWEREFAAQFRFISYDRRACYRSELVDHGFEPMNQAKDLEGLLNHLRVPSAHVVGSSAGGPIALFFTATRP
ncbi:MAG: alpha/beta fold hydrolase [bacterium]